MNIYHIEYSGKNTDFKGTYLVAGDSKEGVEQNFEERFQGLTVDRILKAGGK